MSTEGSLVTSDWDIYEQGKNGISFKEKIQLTQSPLS
jgi:hypothetical protein